MKAPKADSSLTVPKLKDVWGSVHLNETANYVKNF